MFRATDIETRTWWLRVVRQLSDGSVFLPDQRLSRFDALRTHTINAAFEEDLKGSLRPGELADIAVLSKDILAILEKEIHTAKVFYTIARGRVRYRR